MHRRQFIAFLSAALCPTFAVAAAPQAILLRPARVYDGVAVKPHEGWVVLVRGNRIEAAGPADQVKVGKDVRTIELPGMTLLPGLIDAHTHMTYYTDETPGVPMLKQMANLVPAVEV